MAEELVWRSALQFAFAEQWRALRQHCARRSVRVVGDIAIFVNYDSADVWTHPELFRLDRDRNPEVVSGVPPDFFSETGQRWGNPLYRWDVMKQQGYAWWVARLRAVTQHCDYIRLDHFRGFEQFWEIDASEPTAINGRWVDGPKDDLFAKVQEALGGLPFFAEDLGYITPEVHALRKRLQMPGMAVLQFGFVDKGAHMHFFNPVHKMKLLEIVRALETDEDTLNAAVEVGRCMGKEVVVIRESPGFITSRINAMIGNEAFYMLQEGIASASDIDKALKLGLNHPMGPFELVDLVGLDTRLHILEYLHKMLGEKFRPAPLLVQYVKAGRLGRKSGRGVFEYPEQKPTEVTTTSR